MTFPGVGAVARIRRALAAGPWIDENQEDNLTDVLTDLMHWAKHCKLDFEVGLRRAREHFNEEKETKTK